jgi:outer membrane protein assembly factor BamE (lipoprotein component of BamABCDE complex)
MRRIRSFVTLVAASLVFSGCAVGFGSVKRSVDKEFAFTEVSNLKPGMSETQVIELMGKPTAFGVDEHGRQFLLYQITRQSEMVGMVNPILVVGATKSVSLKGFEVRVHLKDGVVQNVGYTLYQE